MARFIPLKIIEPSSQVRGLFRNWSVTMPKAARISSTVSASSASENSDHAQFISVALFSTIGLLISLVAVIMGAQPAWF
jgi:hypothetical protein